MPLDRIAAPDTYLDVLERVLDKGIVIDAEVRVSLVGLEVLRIEAQVVVASFETYVAQGDLIKRITAAPEEPSSGPRGEASPLFIQPS